MVEKNELKPWRKRHWCIGKKSPTYVIKMEDVLDVYERPYDPRRPVVCLDEKHKKLHSTPRGKLLLRSGRATYEDYEYKRHGSCNLFVAVEPLRGWRRVTVTDRRTSVDFAEQLRQLVDEDYPDAEKIVLVTDNLNTHTTTCLNKQFEPAEAKRITAKIEWHYTPEHGSWLNIAESEISALGRQCINRRLADKEAVASEVLAWQTRRNELVVKTNWQFTTQDARIKLKRLYPTFQDQ